MARSSFGPALAGGGVDNGGVAVRRLTAATRFAANRGLLISALTIPPSTPRETLDFGPVSTA